MTLILPAGLNKKRMGDMGEKSLLYYINPMIDLETRAIMLKSVTDMEHTANMRQAILMGQLKDEPYVKVEYYCPAYFKKLMEKDYQLSTDMVKITTDDRLSAMPTGFIAVPKMSTSVRVMRMGRGGLIPSVYFTTKDELDIWVQKGKHFLSALPKQS